MIRTGVLVLTMAIAIACGPRLPMSVEEVFNEAGNDANKLGEVVQRHRVAELAALHEQFETDRKGGVYGARTWEAYARSLSEKQCSKRYASLVECKDANYSTTKSRLL